MNTDSSTNLTKQIIKKKKFPLKNIRISNYEFSCLTYHSSLDDRVFQCPRMETATRA